MLEIKVDGKDVGAAKMVQMAQIMLRLLRRIEKAQTGKTSTVNWRVNMLSGHSYGLIQFFATGQSDHGPEVEFIMRKARAALQEYPHAD